MDSFWDFVWFMIVTFCFVAYLMEMFNIIVDLFRDKAVSGGMKAVWVVCLIFLPFITALIYLIARGSGMAERQMAAMADARAAQDSYIRSVASSSPTDEIAQAKQLLDSGAITQEEFDALKAKALG